jgi:hypothetical protein
MEEKCNWLFKYKIKTITGKLSNSVKKFLYAQEIAKINGLILTFFKTPV